MKFSLAAVASIVFYTSVVSAQQSPWNPIYLPSSIEDIKVDPITGAVCGQGGNQTHQFEIKFINGGKVEYDQVSSISDSNSAPLYRVVGGAVTSGSPVNFDQYLDVDQKIFLCSNTDSDTVVYTYDKLSDLVSEIDRVVNAQCSAINVLMGRPIVLLQFLDKLSLRIYSNEFASEFTLAEFQAPRMGMLNTVDQETHVAWISQGEINVAKLVIDSDKIHVASTKQFEIPMQCLKAITLTALSFDWNGVGYLGGYVGDDTTNGFVEFFTWPEMPTLVKRDSSVSGSSNSNELIYIIVGLAVALLLVIGISIYLSSRRRSNSSPQTTDQSQVDKFANVNAAQAISMTVDTSGYDPRAYGGSGNNSPTPMQTSQMNNNQGAGIAALKNLQNTQGRTPSSPNTAASMKSIQKSNKSAPNTAMKLRNASQAALEQPIAQSFPQQSGSQQQQQQMRGRMQSEQVPRDYAITQAPNTAMRIRLQSEQHQNGRSMGSLASGSQPQFIPGGNMPALPNFIPVNQNGYGNAPIYVQNGAQIPDPNMYAQASQGFVVPNNMPNGTIGRAKSIKNLPVPAASARPWESSLENMSADLANGIESNFRQTNAPQNVPLTALKSRPVLNGSANNFDAIGGSTSSLKGALQRAGAMGGSSGTPTSPPTSTKQQHPSAPNTGMRAKQGMPTPQQPTSIGTYLKLKKEMASEDSASHSSGGGNGIEKRYTSETALAQSTFDMSSGGVSPYVPYVVPIRSSTDSAQISGYSTGGHSRLARANPSAAIMIEPSLLSPSYSLNVIPATPSTLSTIDQKTMVANGLTSVDHSVTSTHEYSNTFTQVHTMISNQRELSLPGFLQFRTDHDFVLRSNLASGGAGSLFIAKVISPELRSRANGLGQCVAKVITASNTKDSLTSFCQEISIMWFFRSSRNFTKLIGFTHTPPTIIMKQYTLGSLDDMIFKDTGTVVWDSQFIFNMLRDVAMGLKEMHEAGFAHCDIKPGNILIDKDERGLFAVLCDFGISRIVTSSVLLVQAFETANIDGASVAYAAPEVLIKFVQSKKETISPTAVNPELIKASDTYSFSMVAYEVITRTDSWPSSMSSDEVIRKVLSGQRPQWTDETKDLMSRDKRLAGLCEIVEQCYVHDPAARMQMKWVTEILEQINSSTITQMR